MRITASQRCFRGTPIAEAVSQLPGDGFEKHSIAHRVRLDLKARTGIARVVNVGMFISLWVITSCGKPANIVAPSASDAATSPDSLATSHSEQAAAEPHTTRDAITTNGVTGSVTLSVSPTSGTQLTTFRVTGSNFSPNGTINRFVQIPGQASQPISSITATASGTITTQWPFQPGCGYPTGTAYAYAVDASTGRKSQTISEQIAAHPVCVAPRITNIPVTQIRQGGGNQPVTVTGSNFQPGLTVSVKYPGGSSTLSGPQIQGLSPSGTSFQMLVDFSKQSLNTTWSASVTNHANNVAGPQSNTQTFAVNVCQPQCTTYVSQQTNITFARCISRAYRDAKYWYSDAQSCGFKTSTTPTAGSIVVMASQTGVPAGHVGIVRSSTFDSRTGVYNVQIAHSNWDLLCGVRNDTGVFTPSGSGGSGTLAVPGVFSSKVIAGFITSW